MWDLLKTKGSIAFIDDRGNSVSYRELHDISLRFGQIMESRVLVALFCQNSIGSAIGYVSFINNGMVPLMINSMLEYELRNKLLMTYLPQYLWIPNSMLPEFDKLEIVISLYGYSLCKTNYDRKYALNDKLALLLTTSGSTGSPKYVRQSYENIRVNTESIVEYLHLDEKERAITTLPMNYTYGLSIINTHIKVGATVLITDKSIIQKEFWQFLNEQRATSFGGVPYTYEILKRIKFMKMENPSLTTMTQAGGKLSPELHEEFARFADQKGKKFIVMYGQCEATARMGYLPADKAIEKKGSIGIPVPGGTFTLVNDKGDAIDKAYTVGELVYKGGNVTLGYAECGDDLAKGDERRGILYTGDMAQIDDDGFYYIVGRKKRFLKVYGNRVNLDELDILIKSRFGSVECACSGIDDHIYIFISDDSLSIDIKEYVVAKTGLNPAAYRVVVIDEIPKTDSGKIMYSELAKYY